jgi:hypothetical protein
MGIETMIWKPDYTRRFLDGSSMPLWRESGFDLSDSVRTGYDPFPRKVDFRADTA